MDPVITALLGTRCFWESRLLERAPTASRAPTTSQASSEKFSGNNGRTLAFVAGP